MTSSLPPAASFNAAGPPEVKLEVEASADSSIDDAWSRLRSTPKPSEADWLELIKAERQSRMAWLTVEDAGGHRRKSTKLAEMMRGSDAAESTKKPRKKSAKAAGSKPQSSRKQHRLKTTEAAAEAAQAAANDS